jgi:Hemerythrin HHE cation binding domain
MTITHPDPIGDVVAGALAGSPSPVTFDLYRDVHKGIRAELFAVTQTAATLDPADRLARVAFADHVRSVAQLLEFHAEHEDTAVDPVLEVHFPELSERIGDDHQMLDRCIAGLAERADGATGASADARAAVHGLYLDLASFVSAYLVHQDLEERVVMPALEAAVGVEAVIGIHERIISAIPPEWMGRSLALMLPAMNLDDRFELLAGMRATAPPEAFQGVYGLAGSVLDPADFTALARRLEA